MPFQGHRPKDTTQVKKEIAFMVVRRASKPAVDECTICAQSGVIIGTAAVTAEAMEAISFNTQQIKAIL